MSLGDMREFAVARASGKDYLLVMMWKARKNFGKEKCPMLVMKSGEGHMSEGIELPN